MGRAGDLDVVELGEPAQQVLAVGGGPAGRLLGLRQGRGGAAGLGGGEAWGRDRPQGLGAAQRRHGLGVAEDVADPQARQAPGLGEAAQHHQAGQVAAGGEALGLAGHRVHERLVDDEGAARPGKAGEVIRGVQYGGGVGRVADDHQVGGLGHRPRIEAEAVRRPQHDAVHRMPGVAQGRLRLRELRVDDDRVACPGGAGQQDERLRGTRREQHLLGRAAVAGGDGPVRGAVVRVAGQPVEGGREAFPEPWRGCAGAHVDGQIGEVVAAVADLGVAVVPQIVLAVTVAGLRPSAAAVARRRVPHLDLGARLCPAPACCATRSSRAASAGKPVSTTIRRAPSRAQRSRPAGTSGAAVVRKALSTPA